MAIMQTPERNQIDGPGHSMNEQISNMSLLDVHELVDIHGISDNSTASGITTPINESVYNAAQSGASAPLVPKKHPKRRPLPSSVNVEVLKSFSAEHQPTSSSKASDPTSYDGTTAEASLKSDRKSSGGYRSMIDDVESYMKDKEAEDIQPEQDFEIQHEIEKRSQSDQQIIREEGNLNEQINPVGYQLAENQWEDQRTLEVQKIHSYSSEMPSSDQLQTINRSEITDSGSFKQYEIRQKASLLRSTPPLPPPPGPPVSISNFPISPTTSNQSDDPIKNTASIKSVSSFTGHSIVPSGRYLSDSLSRAPSNNSLYAASAYSQNLAAQDSSGSQPVRQLSFQRHGAHSNSSASYNSGISSPSVPSSPALMASRANTMYSDIRPDFNGLYRANSEASRMSGQTLSSGVSVPQSVNSDFKLASSSEMQMNKARNDNSKSSYVEYLRRQKATVISDRIQPEILKQPSRTLKNQSHKDKGKKSKYDEFESFTHQYAYYHPKLDMTLELSDARMINNGRPSRMARSYTDDSVKGGVGENATKPEQAIKNSPLGRVYSNLQDSEGNDESEILVNEKDTIDRESLQKIETGTSHGSIPLSGTENQLQQNVTDDDLSYSSAPEIQNSSESRKSSLSMANSAIDMTNEEIDLAITGARTDSMMSEAQLELSRKLSVGSLDEQAIGPRRQLYITNPDYSSSDDE
ncbi:hypothetical protein V1511DRAFT_493760 [Dipodascopsis uninucleata]